MYALSATKMRFILLRIPLPAFDFLSLSLSLPRLSTLFWFKMEILRYFSGFMSVHIRSVLIFTTE